MKNEKRLSSGYSLMSLNKQCFEPIHPYFSLPYLLAQFSIVNKYNYYFKFKTDSWIRVSYTKKLISNPARSFIKGHSHIASCVAELKASYSALVEDLATVGCFLLYQLIVP